MRSFKANSFQAVASQRGAVLFIALVFLLLLTLLSLTAANTSVLEEKMTGGLRNGNLAQAGAESALRAAEARLWASADSTSPFVVCGSSGKFDCYSYRAAVPNSTVNGFRDAKGWTTTGAVEYAARDLTDLGTGDATGNLAKKPRYLIEDLGIERPPGTPPAHESGATGPGGAGVRGVDKHIYRITARSTGGSSNVVRAAESTFAAKSN